MNPMKHAVGVAVLGAFGLAAPAFAQDAAPAAEPAAAEEGSSASAGFSLSTEDGADASASSSGSGNTTPWLDRYPPEGGLIELGLFGGVIFPSTRHALYPIELPAGQRQNYDSPSLDLGLRVAYFPLTFLGLEGEFAFIPTGTDDGASARWINGRAHLVGQLPGMSLTPFLVAGVGFLNADSDSMGDDTDGEFHFGLGAKAAVNRYFSIRLDVRDILSNADVGTNSRPHNIEVLLGLSVTLGRSDRDDDHLLDTMDACPDEAGPQPDGCPAKDSDGDGFLDEDDKCPSEPGVAPDGCLDRDPDKDGVLDPDDRCSTQAGSAPSGCPDSDGDGFVDPDDQCPSEAGIAPDGCPDLDTDKDGVPIPQDQCPAEPETKNGYQDKDGCPDEVPEEVKKFTGVIEGIRFDTGKATIRPSSFGLLDRAVKVLTDFPDLRVEISGHTDSVGSDEANLKLSGDRAASVKAYFVGKGIGDDRIVTRGAGETEPIGDNATAEGKELNRRIEFKLIGEDAPAAAPAPAAEPAPAAAPAP